MRLALSLGLLLLTSACSRDAETPAAKSTQVQALERPTGERYWTEDPSWIELVPSIAVPSNSALGSSRSRLAT